MNPDDALNAVKSLLSPEQIVRVRSGIGTGMIMKAADPRCALCGGEIDKETRFNPELALQFPIELSEERVRRASQHIDLFEGSEAELTRRLLTSKGWWTHTACIEKGPLSGALQCLAGYRCDGSCGLAIIPFSVPFSVDVSVRELETLGEKKGMNDFFALLRQCWVGEDPERAYHPRVGTVSVDVNREGVLELRFVTRFVVDGYLKDESQAANKETAE